MDNFIDKLAQKFTSGEVIRANREAEDRELKRLREQVAEYEKCLQEMRKLQMRNTQTAEDLKLLMQKSREDMDQLISESRENMDKLAGKSREEMDRLTSKSREEMDKLTSESRENMDKLTSESLEKIAQISTALSNDETREKLDGLLRSLEANQKEIEGWFKQADDFLHKENVKVYRNVQAVVVEEAKNGKEAIIKAQEETSRKYYRKAMWMMALTFLAAAAGVIIQLLNLSGMIF